MSDTSAPDLSGYTTEQLKGILDAQSASPSPAPNNSAAPDLSGYNTDDLYAALNSAPAQKPTVKIGGLEALGRGAEQMATLGYAPQINAETQNLLGHGDYKSNLAQQKTSQDAAWDQHPWLYGTGAVASVVPAAIGSVFSAGAPEEAAGVGLGARALAALKGSSNIATLGSTALKGIAGGSGSLASAGAEGVANLAGGTLAQGAIYGSSMGDTPEEKAKDAALGAVGGKIGEKVLGGAATLGGAIGRGVYNKIFSTIAGDPTSGQVAADAAHKLGFTLPLAAATPGPLAAFGAKVDPFHHVGIAAADTLRQAADKVSDLHGSVLPEDAGGAVKDSFVDWLRGPASKEGTSNNLLENIYRGISGLSGSTQRTPLANLQSVVDSANADEIGDYGPTVSVVQKALSNPEGLTFNQIRQLRGMVSDKIDFSKLTQDKTLDQGVLGNMRDAITKDLYASADNVGVPGAGNAVKMADAQAAPIYNLRSVLAKKLGSGAPQDKPDSAVFKNLVQMSSVKSGDLQTLSTIKNLVAPEAWDKFSQGYLQQLAPPEGQFTFGNFTKRWNSISPKAKDLMFGQAGNGGARDTLEGIHTLGQTAGQKIDHYGFNPDTQNMWQTGEIFGLGAEAARGNMGKAAALAAATTGAGTIAARNVAEALPQATARAKYLANNPSVQSALSKLSALSLPKTVAAATQAARQVGKVAGANALVSGENTFGAPLKRWGLLKAGEAANKYIPSVSEQTQQHADGGRITRANGGRTEINHAEEAARLIKKAEIAKKMLGKTTEPLLNVPDDHIAKALAVANEGV